MHFDSWRLKLKTYSVASILPTIGLIPQNNKFRLKQKLARIRSVECLLFCETSRMECTNDLFILKGDFVSKGCVKKCNEPIKTYLLIFGARCVRYRTNPRAIAMMFARLSVWDGRALWSYGHFSSDLSLWLYSPVFWAPWHQSMSTYSQPSFSSFTRKRGGVWMGAPREYGQKLLDLLVISEKTRWNPTVFRRRLCLCLLWPWTLTFWP